MNGAPDPVTRAKNLKTGAYQALEREVGDWASMGMEVRVDVTLEWTAANRPDHIRFEFTVIDPESSRVVIPRFGAFDNTTGQSFDPIRRNEMQGYIDRARA